MKMADKDPLDDFFDAARNAAPKPSDALLARVQADAVAEAERRVTPVRRPRVSLSSVLGGWRGGAGLAAVALTGLVIGYVQPAALTDYVPDLTSSDYDLTDLGAGYGVYVFEDDQG